MKKYLTAKLTAERINETIESYLSTRLSAITITRANFALVGQRQVAKDSFVKDVCNHLTEFGWMITYLKSPTGGDCDTVVVNPKTHQLPFSHLILKPVEDIVSTRLTRMEKIFKL